MSTLKKRIDADRKRLQNEFKMVKSYTKLLHEKLPYAIATQRWDETIGVDGGRFDFDMLWNEFEQEKVEVDNEKPVTKLEAKKPPEGGLGYNRRS